MKAVILAGGLGERLKPFTNVLPKPLIPISGEKTVLEIQINKLKNHGFDEIYIATNYKAELIESYLGDGSKYGVKLFYSRENKPLGTCGPLSLLKDRLDEPFVLMNGDILTDMNFNIFFDISIRNNSPLTVVTKEIITPFAFGNVIVENEKIIHIDEKPDMRFIIIAGIYFLKTDLFKYIPDNQYFGIDELIMILIKNKISIASYFIKDYWVDIGRIDDLNNVIERYKESDL